MRELQAQQYDNNRKCQGNITFVLNRGPFRNSTRGTCLISADKMADVVRITWEKTMSESHEEHNEKQEVDQDSVTTNELREQLNEGLSRSKKQSELIEALIQSQFQPLTFSVETNPLLGPAMRPYIESLREQTRITAFFFARLAGHQEGMADSYWLGAQKYVESLGVWATALAPSVETSFNECSRILREAFPLQKYLHTVWQLAYEMWVNAGRPYFRALDFWASAEKHILT